MFRESRCEDRDFLDFARAFKAPAKTETFIVGNPSIADVVFKPTSGIAVITGRSFGTTNVILLDETGMVLAHSTITVTPPKKLVTVQRGQVRSTYSCDPICVPALQLGDSTEQTQALGQQMQLRNTLAAPPQ